LTVSVKPGQVHFAPGGWAIAVEKSTATVACGEGDSLPWVEQTLRAPDIDGLASRVEPDRDRAPIADLTLDGGDADRCVLALDLARAGATTQVVVGDKHANRGALGADDFRRGGGADPDQLDEGIDGQLPGGAFVTDEAVRVVDGRRIDEAWPTPTW
jgi:hypothetical protein